MVQYLAWSLPLYFQIPFVLASHLISPAGWKLNGFAGSVYEMVTEHTTGMLPTLSSSLVLFTAADNCYTLRPGWNRSGTTYTALTAVDGAWPRKIFFPYWMVALKFPFQGTRGAHNAFLRALSPTRERIWGQTLTTKQSPWGHGGWVRSVRPPPSPRGGSPGDHRSAAGPLCPGPWRKGCGRAAPDCPRVPRRTGGKGGRGGGIAATSAPACPVPALGCWAAQRPPGGGGGGRGRWGGAACAAQRRQRAGRTHQPTERASSRSTERGRETGRRAERQRSPRRQRHGHQGEQRRGSGGGAGAPSAPAGPAGGPGVLGGGAACQGSGELGPHGSYRGTDGRRDGGIAALGPQRLCPCLGLGGAAATPGRGKVVFLLCLCPSVRP